MANPNLIGGGRLTRNEVSGDRRQFQASNLPRGAILLRFWRYLGKNRGLLLLSVLLSVASSLLALYGPKLSGQAINAIDLGAGKVDFDTVYRCALWMKNCEEMDIQDCRLTPPNGGTAVIEAK